jgi:hypothetical protein
MLTPRDYETLQAAAAAAPARGVRITAARGVWRKPDTRWQRFEGPATLAGFVGALTDQDVGVHRGDVCVRVLLGDVTAVTDDVSYLQLVGPLSIEEALELASFELASEAAEREGVAA